jgi:site-specific recombinase XerD
MPANLEKRGDTYHAILVVPKDVRGILGRNKFKRSTKNKKLKNAQITAAPWIAEWWAQIQQARENPDAALERIAKLMALKADQEANEEYHQYEYEYVDGKRTGNKVGYTDAELAIDYYLDDLDQNTKPSEVERMKQLYYGKDGIPLGLFINSWLEDHYSTKPHKTVQEARTAVNRVIEYFPTLTDLTVRNRDLWLRNETRSVSSVQKSLGFVRNYYNWLKANQHIGASEVNPFVAKEIVLNQKLKTKENYLPFEMSELLEIKQAVRATGDERLLQTVEIAQWTGMRLAEIAQLSAQESIVTVDGIECLKVKEDAKTKAGSGRLVPIAKTLADRVSLEELPEPPAPKLDKKTNKLVAYEAQDVGKRFGRLKTKMGYGKQHVFHSIRKTAATVFEQAGVPEGVTADIIGHEKQTMTYGLYSGGTSIKQRQEAILEFEKLMLEKEAEANVLPFSGDKSK